VTAGNDGHAKEEDEYKWPVEQDARKQERDHLRAGGAVGGVVARAFAREGARVFLTGRNLGAINTLAEISAAGGTAEIAQVDALDEEAVASHLDAVVDKAVTVDISFNAIGIAQQDMQGIHLMNTQHFFVDNTDPPRSWAGAKILGGEANTVAGACLAGGRGRRLSDRRRRYAVRRSAGPEIRPLQAAGDRRRRRPRG
jgi:hypothetical protein